MDWLTTFMAIPLGGDWLRDLKIIGGLLQTLFILEEINIGIGFYKDRTYDLLASSALL